MMSPLPPNTPTQPQSGTGDLGWLLVNFLQEVPSTEASVLGTLDGLPQAAAGLSADQSAHLAAIGTSVHSSVRTAGNITDPPGGDVELAIGKLARRYVFVMNTRQGEATDTSVVPTLLTVLAAPDADTRMVGHEMATLIDSVIMHLGAKPAPARPTAAAAAGPGQGPGDRDEG